VPGQHKTLAPARGETLLTLPAMPGVAAPTVEPLADRSAGRAALSGPWLSCLSALGERLSETERLLAVRQRPFDKQPEAAACHAAFPPAGAQHIEVSCSS